MSTMDCVKNYTIRNVTGSAILILLDIGVVSKNRIAVLDKRFLDFHTNVIVKY